MSKNIDRMRFQPNQLSYGIGFLAAFSYIAYIAFTLDYLPKTWILGLEILVSLAFLMMLFQGIDAVKNYSVKWSYNSIALGVVTILRVFWLPPIIKKNGLESMALMSAITIILTGLLICICGIVGLKRSVPLAKYLEETGLINSFSQNADGTKKDKK